MSDRPAAAMFYVLLLILPLGALLARRLPLSRLVRYALLWLAIFAGAVLIVTLVQRSDRNSAPTPKSDQTSMRFT